MVFYKIRGFAGRDGTEHILVKVFPSWPTLPNLNKPIVPGRSTLDYYQKISIKFINCYHTEHQNNLMLFKYQNMFHNQTFLCEKVQIISTSSKCSGESALP